MALLADHIAVLDRFARSMNLERDVDQVEPLDGYVVTARALDVAERVASVAASGRAGGAWSLTGPYGSGKSSLALLLDATFGPPGKTRTRAWNLIEETSPAVAESIRKAHERHRTMESGFHRGLITATREPIGRTLLRALQSATLRRYGRLPSSKTFWAVDTLRRAIEDAATNEPGRIRPSATDMVAIARCLAEKAPLLLIIDEFGKNLEAIGDGNEADPYLLQQLAEAGQGSGLPIFLLTLQHMSFENHLADAAGPRRREWAKVQGRFEDISYVESSRQSRALIGTVFAIRNESMRQRIARWARPHASAMRSLGIAEMADPDVVASCYPLHPLAALLLPEICNRYGQHERTLFSFLAGLHSASGASFLATTSLPSRGSLPSLGLGTVYDYFVSSDTQAEIASDRLRRWSEIALRLRDLHGLTTRETRLVKAIALLNLVSVGGTIRASSEVLSLVDADSTEILKHLDKAGVITFREFAGEYRIWQGTDVDIRRLLEMARQKVSRQPLHEVLSDLDSPTPIVAARHSAKHDVFRVFGRRYVASGDDIEPLDAFSPFDGEVLLVVGSDRALPKLSGPAATGKPMVAAIPDDLTELEGTAREIAAVTAALSDPVAESDWVARRELGERLAESQAAFRDAMTATFGAGACRWVLIADSGAKELRTGRGSTALSEAADLAYPSTPAVGNEMLNRTDLTSQGAKARRLLLEAMIEHRSKANLGLEGYGPEVAMYRAFLARTGLHAPANRGGVYEFCAPTDTSLLLAWKALQQESERAKDRRVNLKDIHAVMLLPPFGMKAAVIPVFVTAALLTYRDEIAIYEHGTFKPLMTPDLSERMVRNPGHFEIKHFASANGARRQVIHALARRLGSLTEFGKHRVGNVLSIVGLLVHQIRSLDGYTRRTGNLRAGTRRVRDAIGMAVEPDELLFDTLPRALGFRPVPAGTKTYSKTREYADSVGLAVEELRRCFDGLLAELFRFLLDTSAESSRLAVMGQAAALDNEVLNPAVRAFVGTLANEAVDADTDWISAVATVIVGKAPMEWGDEDLARFLGELPPQIAAFQRLVALHTERRAGGGGPFDALRVTITRPDGSEHVGLVDIDRRQRGLVDKAMAEILKELGESIGSPHRVHKALLAVLGDRILAEQTDIKGEAGLAIQESKSRYG
ncbi:MAG: hypothetical protein OXG59_07890 [Gammaproteobacteria bacterium]|nr:hypothetical protein [Gammaproteobacteria bacterium]